MDFPRFVAMLQSNGIFFTTIESLGDPSEGSVTQPDAREFEGFRKELKAQGVDIDPNHNSSYSEFLPRMRKWGLVSCWHLNEHESEAMWKLYSATGQAICVQTSFKRLKNCLEATDAEIYLGMVRYISYSEDEIPKGNVFWPFIHKRKSFEHERELRALTCDVVRAFNDTDIPPEGGSWIKTDLSHLIQNVYVAPDAKSWYVDLVRNVCEHYGLKAPVIQSSLADSPLF